MLKLANRTIAGLGVALIVAGCTTAPAILQKKIILPPKNIEAAKNRKISIAPIRPDDDSARREAEILTAGISNTLSGAKDASGNPYYSVRFVDKNVTSKLTDIIKKKDSTTDTDVSGELKNIILDDSYILYQGNIGRKYYEDVGEFLYNVYKTTYTKLYDSNGREIVQSDGFTALSRTDTVVDRVPYLCTFGNLSLDYKFSGVEATDSSLASTPIVRRESKLSERFLRYGAANCDGKASTDLEESEKLIGYVTSGLASELTPQEQELTLEFMQSYEEIEGKDAKLFKLALKSVAVGNGEHACRYWNYLLNRYTNERSLIFNRAICLEQQGNLYAALHTLSRLDSTEINPTGKKTTEESTREPEIELEEMKLITQAKKRIEREIALAETSTALEGERSKGDSEAKKIVVSDSSIKDRANLEILNNDYLPLRDEKGNDIESLLIDRNLEYLGNTGTFFALGLGTLIVADGSPIKFDFSKSYLSIGLSYYGEDDDVFVGFDYSQPLGEIRLENLSVSSYILVEFLSRIKLAIGGIDDSFNAYYAYFSQDRFNVKVTGYSNSYKYQGYHFLTNTTIGRGLGVSLLLNYTGSVKNRLVIEYGETFANQEKYNTFKIGYQMEVE
ncbi:MAG: hypothetical protein QM538_05655 [Methylacidiphilales bacterium]|nr:hypothetical protein [Candidatus Methylacidiphilales bacterium]